ncbi:protein ovarian tumor locus [Drosophila grimshawi]|uniref:GH13741 n=1 Tax=Drosophila grimshawi TaxID=7222 RepID=B4JQR1_DROGR|nr:protein ovarian tumor locus [Drosophila grimshawi]EDV99241.1 GH13741 [Drosophila grimshawi]
MISLGRREQFTSGSPDLQDLFLEFHSLYRKISPRDGNSLFRMIAEQMYDSQCMQNDVRQECVRYMTLKRRIFEKQIAGDFDEYVMKMSKPQTMGTMIELRALCLLYRRNVRLYEPFKTFELVTFNKRYMEYFSVYYTKDQHFDSIYTIEDYKALAVAQAVCYKMLFTDIFKLPDVSYTVEKMLYSGRFNNCSIKECCSFYNRKGLALSCVCQLLGNFCIPFPYKVAKMLDPHTYRNMDRSSCRDSKRTEYLDKIYTVGAMCRVDLSADNSQIGYIQEIFIETQSCLVHIVSMAKKLQMPLANVHPLPPKDVCVYQGNLI